MSASAGHMFPARLLRRSTIHPSVQGRSPVRNASWMWVRANYDVSPDDQRFLMLKPVEQEDAPLTEINVVLNWSEELKRLVPTKGPRPRAQFNAGLLTISRPVASEGGPADWSTGLRYTGFDGSAP